MKEPIVLAALVTGAVGVLFILIGMATTSWGTRGSDVTIGLFMVCGQVGCASYEPPAFIAAVKALVIIAFGCSVGGLIDIIVYYVKYVMKDTEHKLLPIFSTVLEGVAALFGIIGCIIFASGKDKLAVAIGYSFGLTLVGALACGVAAGAMGFHKFSKRSSST